MAQFRIPNIAIRGIASCVPANSEKNVEWPLFSEEDAEKFGVATGVYRRRVADDSTTTADLCYHAARKLLEDLQWGADQVDCLVFVTQTPDYITPPTSCILQQRLGLGTGTYAIDITLGCSGWTYGLSTLAQMMSVSGMRRGLLLAGDTISKFISKQDKSTYPLFGDAGSATAIEYDSSGTSSLAIQAGTDGAGYDAIIIPHGGYRHPFTSASLQSVEVESGITRSPSQLVLNGMDVFSFGISRAPQSINGLLDYIAMPRESVNYFLLHQANLFMNEKIRKKLKLTENQVPYSLADFGNTSAASIPLTMVTKIGKQLQSEHLKLVACGFGVGLSWSSVYFETDRIVCPALIEI